MTAAPRHLPAATELPDQPHPALARFSGAHPTSERLLVIQAPLGSGARWFASDWVGRAATHRVVMATGTSDARRVFVDESTTGPVADPGDSPGSDPGDATGDATGKEPDDVAGKDADQALIETVGTLLDEDPDGRVAVVGGRTLPVLHLAGAFPALIAGPANLNLTVPEVRAFAASGALFPAGGPPRGPHVAQPGILTDGSPAALTPNGTPNGTVNGTVNSHTLTPERICEKTGGWLRGVRMLLQDPLGALDVKHALVSPLLRWIGEREQVVEVAGAAFLPGYTDELLTAFERVSGLPMPKLRRLQELGLVMRSPHNDWVMPILVREVLKETVAESDAHRTRVLTEAGIEASLASGDSHLALKTALEHHSWELVVDLLINHWPELYVRDARVLADIAHRVPRQLLAQVGIPEVGVQLVAHLDDENVARTRAAARQPFTEDITALRLRKALSRLYRHPDNLALTIGAIEATHLRCNGHFAEAGDAAVLLRSALVSAATVGRATATMEGLIHLQAGVSLHLADRLPEARTAYEDAYRAGRRGEVAFILADAASKLALALAQQGHLEDACRWLREVDEPLAAVTWGGALVARTADLARVHLQTAGLDTDAVRTSLAALPAEPGADDFWPVHAQLIARQLTIEGHGTEATRRIEEWRRDRNVASASPLARRLFLEQYAWARLAAGETSTVPGWDRNEFLANLEALRCLLGGDCDGALRALRLPERVTRRHRRTAAIAGVIARSRATPDTVDEKTLRQLAAIQHQEGQLGDLVGFHHMGWTPVFHRIGLLTEAEVDRLSGVRQFEARPEAPSLTPREQEVLRMLREGMTRKQMAASSYRSENTIKGQLRSLYAKLRADSARDALDQARRLGL